ncbi:alpha/beta fold hydrolase [Bdellovibrio sp. NC01]|uniref:alpha/beta fold hydrolase n=1 Tax=Bdellovibrio sp. NC01 TaxID=2220073 RepID=UPI00115A7751|nr:alpha/beta hydrolase [Bdellovibrio sp. NC01]QDK38673.1 alpha/beta hydrolase [Bdellovibrio sp. NC01]
MKHSRLLCVVVSLMMTVMMSSVGFANSATKDVQKTIVLVHGAFADGSSWSAVIPLLQQKGYKVVAVQNPLTSLANDTDTVKRALDNQTGPVVLVGHSWGGMVITNSGDHDKVKALVYVAAFAPDVGESAAAMSAKYPVTPGFSKLVADAKGYFTLPEDAMKDDFAQDLPEVVTKVMTATQGPTFGGCFADTPTVAPWKTKPSWYIVAENDRMIQPDMERDMAKKINAKVTSLATSHVPMLSKPVDIANVIIEAADSIQ